jgi:hypothetical protein
LATVVNRCARSIRKSFMTEQGREGYVQEQGWLQCCFQVIISNPPRTGGLAVKGRKTGKYSSKGRRFRQAFVAIRTQRKSGGCSITVDFKEKGFYSSYTQLRHAWWVTAHNRRLGNRVALAHPWAPRHKNIYVLIHARWAGSPSAAEHREVRERLALTPASMQS